MERPVSPLLASPGFTGAVALLILNDHFLKQAAPGLVTGKLSDFAGVVMIALLTRCLLRHDIIAVALTAVMFVTLETFPGANRLAAPALGGPVIQDAGDLLALIALVPVYVWFRRRHGRTVARTLPISVLQIPALVIAVMATTATSCLAPPTVDRLITGGDVVWAGFVPETSNDGATSQQWARSLDGGRTWKRSRAPEDSDQIVREACGSSRCWRVNRGDGIEVDDGSGWQLAFTFTEDEWKQQSLTADCSASPRSDSFRAVAVVETEKPIVVVAMGDQGVLRLDGSTWERVAVLDSEPTAMPGPTWLTRVPLWTMLGLAAASVALALGPLQRAWYRPRARWFGAAAIALAGAVGLVFVVVSSRLGGHGTTYPQWAAASACLALGAFVAALIIFAWPIRRETPPSGEGLPPSRD
jgi:hypothetical protein